MKTNTLEELKSKLGELEHIKKRCEKGDSYLCGLIELLCDDAPLIEYVQNKLLSSELSDNQYIQAVHEIVLAIYFCRIKLCDDSDKWYDVKANSDNKTDVDIVVKIENPVEKVKIFVEAKACNLTELETGKLHGYVLPCAQEKKEALLADMKMLADLFASVPNGMETQSINPLINNLKDYLQSAQSKFPKEDNISREYTTCLALSVPTSRIGEIVYTIMDHDVGLRCKTPLIDKTIYSKVDYVLVTNVSSGHALDSNNEYCELFNVWELKEYLCYLIPITDRIVNPNQSMHKLFHLLCNDYMHYMAFYNRKMHKEPIYDEMGGTWSSIFPAYLAECKRKFYKKGEHYS